MYTFKEAIVRIEAAGGEVTYDQLKHWEGLGLLEVVAGKSSGGRPPKMLTEESLGAAVSLSRWYRVVRNPEAAKILLWLEGFEYLGIDPLKVIQKLRTELYENLRRKIPSFPPFEQVDPKSPLMDRVLHEIDENFTRRGLADLGGLLPLVFGMIPNPGDFEFEQTYSKLFEGELKDPLPSALDLLMATQSEMLRDTPEIRGYLGGGTVDDPAMLRKLGMAMAQDKLEEVDWEFVRAFWKIFNLAADAAYELWEKGQAGEDQDPIKILINLRYDACTKERSCPGSILMMLVPLSLVISEESRREYKRMVTLFSPAQRDRPLEP